MIIKCSSCEKSFVVPDEAITSSGSLVQCSACGNKWTQYPVQKKTEKEKNRQIKKKITTNKQKKRKNKKNDISTFSQEYLNKKYGIYIKEPLKNNKQIKQEKIKSKSLGFGFYGILLLILIFFTTFLGILNLTKEILIFNFPYLENYINYFYETINNLSIIIKDFFNYY